MMIQKKFILFTLLSVFVVSCGVYETVTNLTRLKFKVDSYNNFRIAEVALEGKEDIDDFSPIDYVKLTGAFISGSLPFSFVIIVEASNPNDGTGGFPPTDLTIESFPFRVLLDEKEVLTGNINDTVTVPGVGQNKVIPISVEIDLIKFFKEKSFEELADFVLAIGGKDGSRSRITLLAKPVLGTPVGELEYPQEIKISHEF
jgi:hypothetical protein